MYNAIGFALSILFIIKIVTHSYLDLSNGESLIRLSTRFRYGFSFLKFYGRDEIGAKRVIKVICNVSYFLALLLVIPWIIMNNKK